MLSVGVVGAGIGGLTVALALNEAGCGDIQVYEAGEPAAADETGLVLSPNASRVLHALGLKDELQSVCRHPRSQLQRAWRSGFLLTQRPLGRFAEDRYGAPHCIISHGALLKTLLNACVSRGITVTGTRACKGVTQSHGRVAVVFGDQRAEHDVLIGCDGTESVVRGFLNHPPATTLNTSVGWGSAPMDSLPAILTADSITSWLGPGQTLIHWPSPDGTRVEYLAITPSAGSDLASQFAAWHPGLGALVDAAESVASRPVTEHEPIAEWHDRRVVLLGDACHALPPQLQQGAAMAMEDAWVLSRMLERWEDEPATGFQEYQRYRKVRITRVRQASRAMAAGWSMRSTRQMSLRNLKLSMVSRFLPEMSMQQLDWLYGYDCIKGFE